MERLFLIGGLFVLAGLCEIGGGYLVWGWMRDHKPLLSALLGAAVLAAGDGTVAFAGMVAGRPVVSIDHPGGLRTTYEPVDASVGAGQPVVRGSPLGALAAGHAGCPVAACLHWGARRGEAYLDPLSLLIPPQVRLLPSR